MQGFKVIMAGPSPSSLPPSPPPEKQQQQSLPAFQGLCRTETKTETALCSFDFIGDDTGSNSSCCCALTKNKQTKPDGWLIFKQPQTTEINPHNSEFFFPNAHHRSYL